MTTPTTTGTAPTPAEIAEYRTSLARYATGHGGEYAYATGVLGTLIELLAADHDTCGKDTCGTCTRLRWGLALRAALEDLTGGAT